MDHETSGAQEWQLPGYGRAAPKKEAVPTAPLPQRQTAPPDFPKPGARKQLPSATLLIPTSPLQNAANARGSSGARGRGVVRARAAHRGALSAQPSRLFRDSPAKSKWRNGLKPNGMVQLPGAFGTFKHEFFGAASSTNFIKKSSARQSRNEVFNEISKRTGAYINPPAYTDLVIQVWGEPHQVTAAQETIKAVLAKCNSFNRTEKRADWTKIHAYSVNKEADAEFKEKRETVVQQLRRPPETGMAYSEKLLFLWPKDGPSLNECLGSQLEYLDIIRAKFGYHVFVPKELPGYICVLGHSHDAMKEIAQRIRTLWAESVAKSSVKTKIYLIEPPEPSAMKPEIVVRKQNNLHKPALQGNALEGDDLKSWRDRVGLIQSRNNTRLLGAIENCLRGVSFVRGHLRMRVNLGTFVLENYQVPEDNRPYYGFEEFREMLLHEQTKGRLIPALKVGQSELLERCFNASHLLERCDNTSNSLRAAELAYSVNFEFLGADKSMLRLEAEFAKSPGAQEYEITQRRWLRPRSGGQSADKRPPLHIAVTDLGRSDWQLEIKSLEFYETSSISTALKTFSHDIGFKHAAGTGDISAQPERKVTFPATAPVSRFVEKTATRYRLKGTKYIFEIARYDEYRRVNVPVYAGQSGATIAGGDISKIPYTSWGASIFDPNWDNLLGDHANLPVGHSASYSPTLATFFPSKESSRETTDGSKGFWEFVDLVKQAAELLGPTQPSSAADSGIDAVSRIESSSTRADSLKDETSSVAISSPTSTTGPAGMLNADLGTLF
ncbi:uncharacterized protein BJX67DRAFT_388073 [Aspergillus lucknowensis]|uniref:DUF7905 domain-containing protein n=1 Tax=Aspergillus lucknowensis TaxID=176173 RepID=A0ABR4M5Z8_9EURO